ncbi:hypothetical protein GCM10028796_54170 [Ramlibacter monticola]
MLAKKERPKKADSAATACRSGVPAGQDCRPLGGPNVVLAIDVAKPIEKTDLQSGPSRPNLTVPERSGTSR